MRFLITALVLLLATPAHARDWWRAETNNFIIISEDSEENTREFAVNLERFDMALRELQNLPIGEEQPTPATKLTVYRFGTTRDIGRMAGSNGVAGFYIARAGDSVAYTPAREERSRGMSVTNVDRNRAEIANLDIISVLQHEYTHYFMLQHFPATYPSWYVEGFAELMATIRLNEGGSFHVGDPPQYRARQIFQLRQFPVQDMLNAKHELKGYEGYQFYGTGWMLTHYLNFNPERRIQLTQYLSAIGNGEDSLTAAQSAFGDLEEINKILRQYREGPFPGYDVAPVNFVEPVAQLQRLGATETALISEEMKLKRGVSGEDNANRLASNIAQEIGANSGNSYGLALLIRAQMAAEEYETAYATAERLIAADPSNIEGPLFASEAAAELSKDDPAWAEMAISFAEDAFMVDSLDPRPRLAYYYSFLASKQDIPENAVIALEGAFETAGSDPSFRVLLARQLLFENRLPDAKMVLQPIAFRGHNQDPEAEEDEDDNEGPPSLDDIMDEINAGDRDKALTFMDELIFYEDEDE